MVEMKELRARSARVVERWHELGVLGEGQCWAEWEGRLGMVEKGVRRREAEGAQEVREKQIYGT